MYSVKSLGDQMLKNQIIGVGNELEKLENMPKYGDPDAQAKHDKEVARVSAALQELISEAKARGFYRKERSKQKAEKKGKFKRGMTGGSPNAQPVAVPKKAPKAEQPPNQE